MFGIKNPLRTRYYGGGNEHHGTTESERQHKRKVAQARGVLMTCKKCTVSKHQVKACRKHGREATLVASSG